MSGTRKGGLKAAATNKLRYGSDMYVRIGRKGGKISTGGGFSGPEGRARAVLAGHKGGSAPRRNKD